MLGSCIDCAGMCLNSVFAEIASEDIDVMRLAGTLHMPASSVSNFGSPQLQDCKWSKNRLHASRSSLPCKVVLSAVCPLSGPGTGTHTKHKGATCWLPIQQGSLTSNQKILVSMLVNVNPFYFICLLGLKTAHLRYEQFGHV